MLTAPTVEEVRDLLNAGKALPNLAYRAPQVCALAECTYRQLDYWVRTHLLEPSIRVAAGSGSMRLFSAEDVLLARFLTVWSALAREADIYGLVRRLGPAGAVGMLRETLASLEAVLPD